MAIDWGAWEGSGNRMRVGLDVSWENVTHGEAGATATVDIWTENDFSWDDDQSLNYGGSLSGSTSFHNGGASGSQTKRATKTYTYNYGSNEYGSSPGSRTFSATLAGAFNGITPSKSVTKSIPARPVGAPADPTNVSVSRVSDTSQKVTWTNKDTAAEPWGSVSVDRETNDSGTWFNVATPSGGSSSYTDSTTTSNRKQRYRVRAENSEGNSAYVNTGYVYTTPTVPTGAVRTNGSGAQQVVTWSNASMAYSEYETRVERGVTSGGVTTWTDIGAATTGATTFTDTGASASQATKYRVRHKTTSGAALYSGYSDETSSTMGTTASPLAPSALSPNGLTVDPTLIQRLSWTFNLSLAGDTQAKYEVQHRIAGTSTWTTTGTVSSASQFYDLPANTYGEEKVVEWQVRTWGADANPSPFAAPVTFLTAVAPIAPDPVKLPVQMDLFTGQLEANTNAYELRDYVMRVQSQLMGGGVRAVSSSYAISWSQRFITLGFGRTARTFPNGHHDINNPFGWTVTNKQIVVTSGISRATLTVSASTMKIRPGEVITVTGVGAPYDSPAGGWVCRSISSNQISFDLPNGTAAQGSTAATGSVYATIRGHVGAADTVPSGTGGGITLQAWTALYYELPFGWGGGAVPKKNGVVNVTNKALTSNVATLSVATGHYFGVGDRIVVAIADAVFDGEQTITAVTPTSFSFAKTNANVTSVAVSASTAIASPSGKDTFFGNFHLTTYGVLGTPDFAVPTNWVLIALRNLDAATVEWGTGDVVDPGFDSDSPVFKQAIFSSNADVNANAGNKPPLRIGNIAGNHMRVDNNEFQAMADDNTVGALNFQLGGGSTQFGSGVVTANGPLHGNTLFADSQGGTGTVGANLGTSGQVLRSGSSERFKRDIVPLELDLDRVYELAPVVFGWNDEAEGLDGWFKPDNNRHAGFIAEQAHALGLGQFVVYTEDEERRIFSFDYPAFTTALLLLAKSQRSRLDKLEETVALLASIVDKNKKDVD